MRRDLTLLTAVVIGSLLLLFLSVEIFLRVIGYKH